ncbi:hypothetical protein [Kaistia defluvii]|uniref:Transcriptional regulator with XRE-family HTH domain n=1 Tax=Kaistia defluvii TaxID=410841 RepID=A0ABV2R5P4_9HYPH
MLTTGNQLKAARALMGAEQKDLAEAAGVHVNTIRSMEAAGAAPISGRASTVQMIQRVIEYQGIEFLNHGQPGVRLRNDPPSFREYLFRVEFADDPRGDFISDARTMIRAGNMPEIASLDSLLSHLRMRGADRAVAPIAERVWAEYQHSIGLSDRRASPDQGKTPDELTSENDG